MTGIKRRGFLGGLAAMVVMPFAKPVKAEPIKPIRKFGAAPKDTIKTLSWIAKEAVQALSEGLGPCVLMGQSKGLEVGQTMRYVHFMRGAEESAIALLVEDSKARGLKRFWIPADARGADFAIASSKKHGVAVRVCEQYLIQYDETRMRFDVIGAQA